VALVLAWGLAGAEALVQAASKGLSRLLHRLLPKGLGIDLCHKVMDELLHCKEMLAAGIRGMKAPGCKTAALEGCSSLDTRLHCFPAVALQCRLLLSPRHSKTNLVG